MFFDVASLTIRGRSARLCVSTSRSSAEQNDSRANACSSFTPTGGISASQSLSLLCCSGSNPLLALRRPRSIVANARRALTRFVLRLPRLALCSSVGPGNAWTAPMTLQPCCCPLNHFGPQPSPHLLHDWVIDDDQPATGPAWSIQGRALPLADAVLALLRLPAHDSLPADLQLGDDVRYWRSAAYLVLETLAQQKVLPSLVAASRASRPIIWPAGYHYSMGRVTARGSHAWLNPCRRFAAPRPVSLRLRPIRTKCSPPSCTPPPMPWHDAGVARPG